MSDSDGEGLETRTRIGMGFIVEFLSFSLVGRQRYKRDNEQEGKKKIEGGFDISIFFSALRLSG